MSIRLVPRGRSRLLGSVLILVLAIGFVAACSKSSKKPTVPETPTPPTPNSPVNALALLRWCWEQRDTSAYHEVFTNNFEYDFATSDGQSPGTTIDRAEELRIGANLFTRGVTGHAHATSITFRLDNLLSAVPDDRPGKNATWHKRITTHVRLTVNAPSPSPSYSTIQDAVFYVTRGDSVQIPVELIARGFTLDPNRWYVDTWIDQTTCPPSKTCVTVGTVKLDYAGGPVIAVRGGR